MYRLCLTFFFVLTLVWSIGCGGPPPKGAAPAATVKGIVNIDGKPVPTGEIHMGSEGIPPRVLQITNGAFSGEAPIGKNQVEVFIYVEGPPSEKYPGVPTKKNTTLPKYYGPKSTLDATVTAGGANEFKFDITSK